MLNDRDKGSIDYTSISSKGVAVVGYAIVHQDLLPLCDNIPVLRAAELFDQTGMDGTEHNISDHSLLYRSVTLLEHTHNDDIEHDVMCDNSSPGTGMK